MAEEKAEDGTAQAVAALLRSEPAVVRWEDLEAVGTTPKDWVDEIREIAGRAGVEVESVELERPRMTAVFNKKAAPRLQLEAIHARVAQLDIDRKLHAADANVLADPESTENELW